jgi:hypothetical protein
MQDREPHDGARFFFSLSRLIAKLRGKNAGRTEQNWIEANVVGAAFYLVTYLCVANLLLSGLARWMQIALLLPVVFLVWAGWLILFYAGTLLIRLLRAVQPLPALPAHRIQGVLSGIVTTACAWQLLGADSWLRGIGLVWLIAVGLNLVAAAVLALGSPDGKEPVS